MKTFNQYFSEGNVVITDEIQRIYREIISIDAQGVINNFFLYEYGDMAMYNDNNLFVENIVKYQLLKNYKKYEKIQSALTTEIQIKYNNIRKIEKNGNENINRNESININNTDITGETTSSNTTNDLTENSTNTISNETTIKDTTNSTSTTKPNEKVTKSNIPFDSEDFVAVEEQNTTGENIVNTTNTNDGSNLETGEITGNIKNTGTVDIAGKRDIDKTFTGKEEKEGTDSKNILENILETEENPEIITKLRDYINFYLLNYYIVIIDDLKNILSLRIWFDY